MNKLWRKSWRPPLALVLLVVNFLVLLLPVGSLAIFRFYDQELVRRTEAAVLGQAALVRELYRQRLIEGLLDEYGEVPPEYGQTVTVNINRMALEPKIDILADPVLPPLPRIRRSPITAITSVALTAGQKVNDTILRGRAVTPSTLRVLDIEGRVVASTLGDEGSEFQAMPEFVAAMAGRTFAGLRKQRRSAPNTVVHWLNFTAYHDVVVAVPVFIRDRVVGAVLASSTPVGLSTVLYDRRGPLLIAISALLVITTLLTLFLALVLNQPLRQLVGVAQRLGDGKKPDETAPMLIIAEFDQLYRATTRMAGRLADRADYIQAFARSVSHEFKSPLTSIRGAAELMLEDRGEMMLHERQQFLENIDHEAARLQALVTSLHELAKADTVDPAKSSARLAVVREVAARFATRGPIDVHCEHDDQPIAMAAEVLDTILGNLFENAFMHGGPEVAVTVAVQVRAELVEIEVADNGVGISPGNRAQIFDPFFSTARQRGGTGLGLAVVATILKAHGGEITLSDRAQGSAFVLQIPRQSTAS